jgi:hypothetical protein
MFPKSDFIIPELKFQNEIIEIKTIEIHNYGKGTLK